VTPTPRSPASARVPARRSYSSTAGPASASTTCAISPRSSPKKTTSRGTSSGDRPRQPSTGRTRWRPTSTTLDASSTRSAGTRRTWSVTRGAVTSPCRSPKRCRTASSACSASIRSGRSATVVGRSSTKSSSGRTPESVRARARELDELSTKREADDALAIEGMRLVWPAYFADPEAAPPMPELRMASERSAQIVQSINAELPKLEAGLPQIRMPVGFVHGSRSPMPVEASTDAAERIPGAWVDVVEGAGHFHLGRGSRGCSCLPSAAHRRVAASVSGR
jgi:pimeloyl-ACP methyl ester carboxylesterase